ncbi:MAG: 16S rRNA processing protein RimM [Proteobacteria bacterium]|nr:16S rRNA processing protein RimM [Pseudomonadota bacterium]
MSDQLVLVAEIIGSHGVKGQFKIRSFTSDPLNITSYLPLLTEDKNAFQIKTLNYLKDNIFLAFKADVTDRDKADQLKGLKLYIQKEKLPSLQNDEEYYFIDLMGCEVFEENELIGKVTEVCNFGAGTFLDIEQKSTKKMVTLPFTKDAVLNVDIINKKIIAAKDYILA